MKIAILSDFHLGYERFKEDAFKQAMEALEKASESADLLLIPGDIFDTRTPKPETLAEAINLFRGLSSKIWGAKVISVKGNEKTYTKLPIIAIAGTHERRAQNVETPVGLLSLAGLLIDISQATAVIKKDDEVVAVCGIGGIDDERFSDVIKEAAPSPMPNAFNVFMFHESIYELLPFNERFAKLDDLPKGFDLYVNGHIHSKMEEKVHGKPFLIPGSTVLTQLKEGEQERKGFWVFDTASGKHAFSTIGSRTFYYVKIDVNGLAPEELLSTINRKIEAVLAGKSEKPVIRIVLNGKFDSKASSVGIDLHQVPKKYKDLAIVEISNNGSQEADLVGNVMDAKTKLMDNASIKDLGLSIFLDKYREKKGGLKISPRELFELLSSDGNKDKILKSALEELI